MRRKIRRFIRNISEADGFDFLDFARYTISFELGVMFGLFIMDKLFGIAL